MVKGLLCFAIGGLTWGGISLVGPSALGFLLGIVAGGIAAMIFNSDWLGWESE